MLGVAYNHRTLGRSCLGSGQKERDREREKERVSGEVWLNIRITGRKAVLRRFNVAAVNCKVSYDNDTSCTGTLAFLLHWHQSCFIGLSAATLRLRTCGSLLHLEVLPLMLLLGRGLAFLCLRLGSLFLGLSIGSSRALLHRTHGISLYLLGEV